MLYGYLTENIFPVLLTFGTGEAFAIAYLGVYYCYTTERAAVRRRVLQLFAALLLVTLYAVSGDYALGITHQSKHSASVVVGYIAVTVCMLLFASPLATLRRVLQTKSAASIPILMCVVGAVGNSLWVTYGAMIGDVFMWLSNVVCVALGVVQIIVYVIYNPKHQVANASTIATRKSQSTPQHERSELLDVVVVKATAGKGSFGSGSGSSGTTSDDSSDDVDTTPAQDFYALQSPRVERQH